MNDADFATLILLRHGETEWNLSGRWQGQAADTRLTELGRQQARAAAHRLRCYPISAIYSSDLLRLRDRPDRRPGVGRPTAG